MTVPTFAYLAEGRLFLQSSGTEAVEVTSTFVQEFETRQAKQQQQHGWKEQSQVWGEMGMAVPQMAQWNQAGAGRRTVKFRSLDHGPTDGEVTYLVDFGNMTGLFQYDPKIEQERRLFHRNNFPAQDLCRHPLHGRLAISVAQPDGTKRLAICEADGCRPREITFGDSIDEMPRWVHNNADSLVFQSAGIGRDANGFATILGPYAIQKLHLQSEAISTVMEDDAFDYLQPTELADGTLLYLRRPYQAGHRRQNVLAEMVDILLIPYRLARAGYYFLNFFSVMFSGQPLRTAGGPERPTGPETQMLSLWGQMIDTRKQMRAGKKNEDAGLVPNDWQLVRRSPSGTEDVLAKGVLTFDVRPSGEILYTNGRHIWLRPTTGETQKLGTDRFIERVLLLGVNAPE
ncbi:MAG: hypothetical protein Q8K78_09565 [Planctomycetaceae bacterium]|nr:hypothetical protein [Planctomycetaceae bacterium]